MLQTHALRAGCRRLFSCAVRNRQEEVNPAGIHHIHERLRKLTFGKKAATHAPPSSITRGLTDAALRHLRTHGLLGQRTTKPEDLNFELPQLLGDSDLDEHFQKIGNYMLSPYLQICQDFIASGTPQRPDSQWVRQAGWTRYSPGLAPERVEFPHEDAIVFDTEVLYEISNYPVMATAVSAEAHYTWLSPWLLRESSSPDHLIPLGTHRQVVIGHYVAYDRQRVKEEYSLNASPKWFLDTMSLHIACNGMCNQQRPVYLKYEKLLLEMRNGVAQQTGKQKALLSAMLKKEPWLRHTSPNGLDDVVKFHLGDSMDKSPRDFFKELTVEGAGEPEMLQCLVSYCALDSWYTKRVFDVLLPKFRELNPHPVSLAALRPLGSVFLPVTEEWQSYIDTAEAYYSNMLEEVNGHLRTLADEAAAFADNPEKLAAALNDPWLSQLDWTVKPIKYTKAKGNQPPRPFKNQKMPGKPEWYKSLFTGSDVNLTVRSRVTPLLLRLNWDGHPLYWSTAHGWTFWASIKEKEHYKQLNYAYAKDNDAGDQSLFKLPHPDGEKARCTNPLAKSYLTHFESGVLSSRNKKALDAISSNLECSYWISARQRILDQVAIFQNKGAQMGVPSDYGIILPRLTPMGAVTRRAVEDTWLTASNAKRNRIGSELKSNVRAPPGYSIVGADVDSQELWIASVLGDSIFRMHGGTAMGWMTLEGTKQAGTDLHSKSAQILGINRNEAKVFNYGRIYGAGQPSASRKLKEFNPALSVSEAQKKARALYASTKGNKTASKCFPLQRYWRGGTESIIYNQLELIAEQPRQRTPILGAGITDALASGNLRSSSFLTTRVNWSIQSSGVDYLHLLIASMHYLTDVYNIKARLLLTVHDEVRFLVSDGDKYRAALALQISNLWTRAMFCQQLGLNTLPHSVAFFSLIDLDNYLRKEVDDPCITPSHPDALPPGEALDMSSLLLRSDSLGSPDAAKVAEYERKPAIPRKPVMADVNDSPVLLEFVNAQIGSDAEAKRIEAQLAMARENERPVTDDISQYGVYRGNITRPPPQPQAEVKRSDSGSVSIQIMQSARGRAMRSRSSISKVRHP